MRPSIPPSGFSSAAPSTGPADHSAYGPGQDALAAGSTPTDPAPPSGYVDTPSSGYADTASSGHANGASPSARTTQALPGHPSAARDAGHAPTSSTAGHGFASGSAGHSFAVGHVGEEAYSPGRTVFRPVVDVRAGAAVLVDADIHAPAPQGRDAALAAEAAEDAARHEALLPLLLSLDALTVAHAPAQLDVVHEALRRNGRSPREVILCVGGRVGAADRRALVAAVARLRSYGYFVALGTASVPIDLVAEIQPYLIRLEPELTGHMGTGHDGAGAVIATLADLCERIGGRLMATQVTDEAQLNALARAGVGLAQGPLFAADEWRPAHGVNLPAAPPPERDQTQRWIGPRVGECLVPAVTLPESATAEQVLDLFGARQDATSVILLDAWQRPAAAMDRNRFLLAVSGPYGHALHARRPAMRLAAPPRLVPHTVPAIAALHAAGRDTERVYDDLVVTDEVGRCLGVVRVSDLIRRLGDA